VCLTQLLRPTQYFLRPNARPKLHEWLSHAKTAMAVRHAASREAYEKALFTNARNCQYKLNKVKIVLDKRTIANALGKRQPLQRIWGLSGPIILGVNLVLQLIHCLEVLLSMSSSVSISASMEMTQGCSSQCSCGFEDQDTLATSSNSGVLKYKVTLSPIFPCVLNNHRNNVEYIAITPDDILAVQEWRRVGNRIHLSLLLVLLPPSDKPWREPKTRSPVRLQSMHFSSRGSGTSTYAAMPHSARSFGGDEKNPLRHSPINKQCG
jgi:hypothetical protein